MQNYYSPVKLIYNSIFGLFCPLMGIYLIKRVEKKLRKVDHAFPSPFGDLVN